MWWCGKGYGGWGPGGPGWGGCGCGPWRRHLKRPKRRNRNRRPNSRQTATRPPGSSTHCVSVRARRLSTDAARQSRRHRDKAPAMPATNLRGPRSRPGPQSISSGGPKRLMPISNSVSSRPVEKPSIGGGPGWGPGRPCCIFMMMSLEISARQPSSRSARCSTMHLPVGRVFPMASGHWAVRDASHAEWKPSSAAVAFFTISAHGGNSSSTCESMHLMMSSMFAMSGTRKAQKRMKSRLHTPGLPGPCGPGGPGRGPGCGPGCGLGQGCGWREPGRPRERGGLRVRVRVRVRVLAAPSAPP